MRANDYLIGLWCTSVVIGACFAERVVVAVERERQENTKLFGFCALFVLPVEFLCVVFCFSQSTITSLTSCVTCVIFECKRRCCRAIALASCFVFCFLFGVCVMWWRADVLSLLSSALLLLFLSCICVCLTTM